MRKWLFFPALYCGSPHWDSALPFSAASAAQAQVPKANATPPWIYPGHDDCVNSIRASPVPEIKGCKSFAPHCMQRPSDQSIRNTRPLFSLPPPPNRAEFQSASFIPAPPNWNELMPPWDIDSRSCSRPPLRLLIRPSLLIWALSRSSHPPLVTVCLFAGCADLHSVFIIPADESASCPLSSVLLAIFPGASLFASRSSLHF